MRRKTSNDYIRHVRTFTTFLGRLPDGATAKDLRRCSPTHDGFLTSAVLRRIIIQDGGRHRRWGWADAPPVAQRRASSASITVNSFSMARADRHRAPR